MIVEGERLTKYSRWNVAGEVAKKHAVLRVAVQSYGRVNSVATRVAYRAVVNLLHKKNLQSGHNCKIVFPVAALIVNATQTHVLSNTGADFQPCKQAKQNVLEQYQWKRSSSF